MAHAKDRYALVLQNLNDAGCDAQTKEKCMTLLQSDRVNEICHVLKSYRSNLLSSIRTRQKQLDCVDYLLYQLNK